MTYRLESVIKRRQGRNLRQQPGGTEVEVMEECYELAAPSTWLNLLLYTIPGPPAQG